jgi:hypothetical protein
MQSRVPDPDPEPDTAKPYLDPYVQNTDPDMGSGVTGGRGIVSTYVRSLVAL